MTDWRTEIRTCACGMPFIPKREKQRHCSSKCGTKTRVSQHRTRYRKADPTVIPEKPLQAVSDALSSLSDGPTMVWPERPNMEGLNPDGSTPGALPGTYPLEYYEDGYPKLPACLDRRPIALAEAA